VLGAAAHLAAVSRMVAARCSGQPRAWLIGALCWLGSAAVLGFGPIGWLIYRLLNPVTFLICR